MNYSVIEPLEARIAPATLTIAPVTQTIVEGTSGDQTLTFHVMLAEDAAADPITVNYGTHDGTASPGVASAHAGVDYVPASGTLTFPAANGLTSQSMDVTVTVHGHTGAAPVSAFTVGLSGAMAVSSMMGQPSTTTVTIDPTQGTASAKLLSDIGVTVHDTTVQEGNSGTTSAFFQVNLTAPVPVGYTLDVAYQTLEAPGGPLPTDPTMAVSSFGSKPSTFYDYAAVTAGHVTLTAGQQLGYLPVLVSGDMAHELDETFGLKVVSATLVSTDMAHTSSGSVTVAGANATGTIVDDDVATSPTVKVSAVAPTIPEGGSTAQHANFTLSLSAPVPRTLHVTLNETVQAMGGGPATTMSRTVSIPAGQSSATFSYDFMGDAVTNHDQTVTENITGITLNDGTSAPNVPGGTVKIDPQHTAHTIIQDDDALVSVAAPAAAIMEGDGKTGNGTTPLSFPVTLSAPADHAVVVTYSTVDGTAVSTGSHPDFVAKTNAQVTINAGDTQGLLTVDVIGDTLAGPDESFKVHIVSVTGAATPVDDPTTPNVHPATVAGTITSDDTLAKVTIAAPSGSVAEGGTANFVAKLSAASENDVVVHYTVAPGTATASRYTVPTAMSVTIPAGQLQALIPIAITTDTKTDPQSSFSVTLGAVTNAANDTTNQTATGVIAPTNLPTVNIADAVYPEGATGDMTSHDFTVTLSAAATTDIDLLVSTSTHPGDTAVAGTDYVALTNTPVHIAHGMTSVVVPVKYLGNNAVGPDKTFHLDLTETTTDPTVLNNQLGLHSSALAVIQNDDTTYSITSTSNPTTGSVTVTEGATGAGHFASFTITRANTGTGTSVDGSVHYSTFLASGDKATSGQDFLPVSGTVNFTASSNSQTILIPILDDNHHEATETFSVGLSGAFNGVISSTLGTGKVSITDNDAQPTIHVSGPVAIKEGNSGTTDLIFNVTLDHPDDAESVMVTAQTVTGTGSADFPAAFLMPLAAADSQITFLPGVSEHQVTVKVIGNTVQNAAAMESFKLMLSTPINATLDASNFGVGTVIDDDPAPVVSVAKTATTTQGSPEAFTLSLSNASAVPIDAYYYTTNGTAHTGTDFTGNDAAHLQKVTFAPGTTTATINIATTAPANLAVAGPDETFQLHLAKVVSDPASAAQKPLPVSLSKTAALSTGTIHNATQEFITINDVSVVRGLTGDQPASFTVSLSNPSSVPVTVHYSTVDGTATVAQGDYMAKTGTLTFLAGKSLQQTVKVMVHGSLAHENAETFTVALSGASSNATIGRPTGTGTITDTSTALTLDLVPVTASSIEGDSGTTHMLDWRPTLSATATVPVTFTVSTGSLAGLANAATAGVDYTATSKTFTIPAGSRSPTTDFLVPIIGDTVFEPTEQLSVKVTGLSNAVAGKTNVVGTIYNDDFFLSGRVAKWNDTDGDLVTLTVSKGALNTGEFLFTAKPTTNQVSINTIGGRTLENFDIFAGGQQFLGTNILITATPQLNNPAGTRGDGLVNIGTVQANNGDSGLQLQGFDLGAVTVQGNLDQIFAGDLFTDVGLKTLHVHSFGTVNPGRASFIAEGAGTIQVDTDFSGNLQIGGAQFGKLSGLVISGALRGATTTDVTTGALVGVAGSGVIGLSGALGSVKLGSIVSSAGVGTATLSALSIGTLSVQGNIDNSAAVDPSGSLNLGTTAAVFSSTTIGKVTIGGSVLGGSVRAQSSIASVEVAHDLAYGGSIGTTATAAVISAGGFTTNQALLSVIVHGNVAGGKILAGYQNNGTVLSADAQIGLVQIDGNVQALDIVAGAAPGTDGFFGTNDDQKIAGGDNASMFSRIAKVVIGGAVTDDGMHHGIDAEQVTLVLVGGVALPLTGAPDMVPVGGIANFQVQEKLNAAS